MATEELWFTEWEFGGPPWTSKAREQFLQWSPHLFAHNIKTPTLIITNEQDFRVPVDQGLQMFTVLRRNGVPPKRWCSRTKGTGCSAPTTAAPGTKRCSGG